MVKLICLDLDATTLDNSNNISPDNMEAIQRAIKSGVKVIITTGRSFEMSIKYSKEIGGKEGNYLVCYNGASVWDIGQNKEIVKKTMTFSAVNKILDIADSNGIKSFGYSVEAYKAFTNNAKSFITKAVLKSRHLTPSYGKTPPCYKIIAFCLFKNKIQNALPILKKELKRFEVVKSSKRSIEVTSKGVSKWSGVQEIMKIENISAEEIAAVGDSQNDLELMKNVKFPIAVKNAFPEVKKAAYYTTAANNNNSAVAEAINYILDNINNR